VKIICLAENTSASDEYGYEHGLSVYVQTNNHKLLFDTGKTDLFIKNANKLGVSIKDVDTLIVSHGHYDHGGGLEAFLSENSKAEIYIHKKAFDEHYSLKKDGLAAYIGLNKQLMQNKRIIFTEKYLKIDNELELFSDINGFELLSSSNSTLYMKQGDLFVKDSFEHEQSLIISENSSSVLIAGCAHRGIINIVNRAAEIIGTMPDYVIGGFHLSNPNTGESEPDKLLNEIGSRLKQTNSHYYTCHCTGQRPYEHLKNILKEKINYLAVGTTVEI